MQKEKEIFERFLKENNLKKTKQREKILNLFLKVEDHLSADEFYGLIKKKIPWIGYTTVYRTLKLFSRCGLAREVDMGDGIKRFEHKFGHGHHDHLICVKCGKSIEVVDPEIEKLQEKLIRREGFTLLRHRLEIFGVCPQCRKREKK